MTDEQINAWADSIKKRGSLKIGDILDLPAGLTQTISTYYGDQTICLRTRAKVKIRHIDYGYYCIIPMTDEDSRAIFESRLDYLYKPNGSYHAVITLNDQTAKDWSAFVVDNHPV